MPALRTVAIVLAIVSACPGAAFAAGPEYHLGPQDQLQVKVYDLRTGTGEAYQWTAFNGDFTVSASGRVALPLVGELDASDKTTADLADEIARGLQAKVGLAAKPDAAVQVIKYRPFYVMGSVEKPGEYEFRPDLTVLQAVSLAGGLERATSDALLGYVRDALTLRGDLRALTDDRIALLARQARLEAEIAGADKVTVPPDLQGKLVDPGVATILREEELLFEARRHAIRSQSDALEQGKILLRQEIDSLAAKDVALGHQHDAAQKELQQITGLVSKGLTVLPRQLEMEQSTAQLESNRLDVAVATLHARQDIEKADRDILELTNTRRSEALQEATEVGNKLADTTEKIDTTQRLILHVEVRAPSALSAEATQNSDPDFFITRRDGGAIVTLPAKEDDPVQPGDVVRVVPKSPSSRVETALTGQGPPKAAGARTNF